MSRARRRLGSTASILTGLVLFGVAFMRMTPAHGAATYTQISGAGSTWSANAISQWIADVQQFGMQVNYAPTGSSDGRQEFLQGTVDFAGSDIPFQSRPEDGSQPEEPKAGSYAYIPITSGGTVFAYNLVINGQRVTNLRLSGVNIAKIFTGAISNWNDPALAADNPQLALPDRPIVPVVRSDGSGSSALFTMWMINQYPDVWNAFCQRSGRAPKCGPTSYYPTVTGMIAQNGDLGVMGYVAQNYAQGAIGYVQYSYALNARFPVAKMLNKDGYYTEPTPFNVAVSLLKAQVDTTDVNDPSLYLTQKLDGVYSDDDARTYPLSGYSYLIIPTTTSGQFTTGKGRTLADFLYYAMCQGQTESAGLGYSPMPINLVEDSFDQIKKIPGAVVQNINIQSCKNPTLSSNGENELAQQAPMPQACDKQGPVQCSTGTGGAGAATAPSGASGSTGGSSSGGGGSAGSSGGAVLGSGGGAATTGSGGGSAARVGATSGAVGLAAGSRGAGSSSRSAAGRLAAACDPSTQNCGASRTGGSQALAAGANSSLGNVSTLGGDTSAGDATNTGGAFASTTVLVPRNRWTAVFLTVLIVILALGLVLAPGLTSLYFGGPRE